MRERGGIQEIEWWHLREREVVLDLAEMFLVLSPFGGVTGDMEFAGEGSFKHKAGGVGSWGWFAGVGYESTDDLCDAFSEVMEEVVDSGERGGTC